MVKNRFINMTHFSETTHLNTVSISGLLCHIAVFLLYARDVHFLDPITLIHYNPTSLLDKYLPAISTSIKPLVAPMPQPSPMSPTRSVPTPKRNVIILFNLSCLLLICLSQISAQDSDIDCFSTRETSNPKRVIHAIGDPLERSDTLPTGLR